MRVIDEANNGGTVEVAPGEPFRIQLYENPTTGYCWHLVPPNDPAFRAVEDGFDPAQDKPGAGGVRHWTVTADRPGAVTLHFERKRAWETNPAATFTVTIEAKVR